MSTTNTIKIWRLVGESPIVGYADDENHYTIYEPRILVTQGEIGKLLPALGKPEKMEIYGNYVTYQVEDLQVLREYQSAVSGLVLPV